MLTEQNGIQVDKFYPPVDWQYSFPEGYTRLEYLQSSGTQWIDTGVIKTINTRTLLTIKSKDTSGNKVIYGLNGIAGQWFGTNNEYYGIGGTNGTTTILANTKQTCEITILYKDSIVVTIGNETITRIWGGNEPATNYLLFSGGSSYYSSVLFYSCIIKDNDNGTLLRNFVPVKRNSDNKPGMYDLVNNVFYVNQGTGEFVMGPELYSNNSQIDIRQKNNTNFVEKYKFNENNELVWANPQLNLSGPVGYTKVGNPIITDNVVSGFSSANYLSLNKSYILTQNDNIEFYIRFKVDNLTGNKAMLNIGSIWSVPLLSVYQNYISGLLIGDMGTAVMERLEVDTYYRLKIVMNNGISKGYLYNDDESVRAEKTSNLSFADRTGNFLLGAPYGTANPTINSLDLKETYIKVNDKLWFYGKNYTSENYAPVPAGLNYNNTTTPSIGYVNTQTQEFIPAPTDGIKYSQTRDLKVIPPEDNTITLLYGVASDFSKYALFGLLAQVSSGTYDVYIDDILYATTTKNTQTDIDFSTLGSEYVPIGTCTTPEELVLHKIVIKPTTSGETITAFRTMTTTGAANYQQQGVIWGHFELTNIINLSNCFSLYTKQYNINLVCVTAKNNIINTLSRGLDAFVSQGADLSNMTSNHLQYIPSFYFTENENILYGGFCSTIGDLKRVRFICDNLSFGSSVFNNNQKLEQININVKNIDLSKYDYSNLMFHNNYNNKLILKSNIDKLVNGTNFLTNATNLYPTKINITDKTTTKLDMYGTSTYPMRGLRGLKVSNEAPFTGTSPQINVSYTGLDRDALVELFNSMPDVSEATDGITRQINITAATGNNLTKVGTGVTIDENGVASGFSSSNYLRTNDLFNSTKAIQACEIQCKFKFDPNTFASTGTQQQVLGAYFRGESDGIRVSGSGRVMWYILGSQLMLRTDANYLQANLNYIARGIINNGIAKLYVGTSENNLEEVVSTNIPSEYTLSAQRKITIGVNTHSNPTDPFNNIIDLEQTYVKVDNNYIVKGYLTDNDKLIATNKGWTITG